MNRLIKCPKFEKKLERQRTANFCFCLPHCDRQSGAETKWSRKSSHIVSGIPLTMHYVSACGIRPKTQFWLFQHIRHSEGALGCKTKVPSWIFDFHQFSGAHWGGWSEPIRDLFVTFLKMCAISIISVWRPNMVSLWSFIVSTSPSVNNFSYLWQNIQILSQTLTKT